MSDRVHGRVHVTAPGRVNLIGDHTDHCGGPVLPMAIDLVTTIEGTRGGPSIALRSEQLDGRTHIGLPVTDPTTVQPSWGRYVAGVAALLGPADGLTGVVSTTLPLGAGLSSSAAFVVAAALALGMSGSPVEVATLCRDAEELATGVPCGIMDQLCSVAAVEGTALLIDCSTLDIRPIPVPDDAVVWIAPSGEVRSLAESAYATRRSECVWAERLIGPLPIATPPAIDSLDDPVIRARARHVRTESGRVRDAAEALVDGDLAEVGRLMVESHRSLRDDFEVSTPAIDRLVELLCTTPGVYGARLTGGGFGGSVVALAAPGVDLPGRIVRPSAGASVTVD